MNIRKNKFLINIIIIICAFAVIICFLIIPNLQAITKINEDISQERQDLEMKASLGLNIKQISQDLAELEKDIDLLNKIFVRPGEELELLNTLDKLSQNNGITTKIIPQFPENNNGKLLRIPLEIKADGKYQNLIGYLKAIEKMPYYYNIDNIELIQNSTGVAINLNGAVYSKK